MQYSQEHLKTMVYAEFGGQTGQLENGANVANAK